MGSHYIYDKDETQNHLGSHYIYDKDETQNHLGSHYILIDTERQLLVVLGFVPWRIVWEKLHLKT